MISIAMTTYNGEKYLREQLDSILAQTIQDFELIICDDCSTDSTVKILNEYAGKNSCIKVFVNENNLGFKKNFEKAIGLCIGEYIALSDQDDIWKENHLELLLSNLQDKSASVGNANIMDSNGIILGRRLSEADCYTNDIDDNSRLSRIISYGNPFQGASSLYKHTLFEKAMPIPKGIEYHDAWFSACACCTDGLNYSFDPITNYRVHNSNASGNHHNTFWNRIKTTLKRQGYKTDRVIFCEELLKRFPDMDERKENIIFDAQNFYLAREKGKRIKVMSYIIKNYKEFYGVANYKLLFPRIIGILLKG